MTCLVERRCDPLTGVSKPIPDSRPAKQIGEYLRELRRGAGNPSYRLLDDLGYTKHNALSQIADGRYVGWARVLKYVAVLRQYQPGSVTDTDLAELRRLHDEARARIESTQIGTKGKTAIRDMWTDFDTSTSVTAILAASTRAPGQWEMTRLTDWRRLNAAVTVDDLVDCLYDLIHSRQTDLHELQYGCSRASRFSWFATPAQASGPLRPAERHEWLVLTKRREATLPVLLTLVRGCGGTDGDCQAWEGAWNRVTTTAPTVGMQLLMPAVYPPPAVEATPAPQPEVPTTASDTTGSDSARRLSKNRALLSWPGQLARRPQVQM